MVLRNGEKALLGEVIQRSANLSFNLLSGLY